MLPNRVALPSLVMWMPVCQAARSAAKKKAARSVSVTSARFGQCTGGPITRAIRNRNGSASASRQKPAATGPTPASRTSHGPNASEQLPISSAANANGWALAGVTRRA
jgi:hypothetical protein